MLPFVMMPRPLQESNVVGKGGTAGFLGKAFDPYTIFPEGDDMDMVKMDRVKVDDLQLRPEVFSMRLERRAKLRQAIDAGMPEIERAVSEYHLDESYTKALSLIISGRAREAFNLSQEPASIRDLYGRTTFGQILGSLARRLVEAGTRVVEVVWPKVANSDNHSWDHHVELTKRMKAQSGPMLDAGLSGLLTDLDNRGLLEETLVVAVGEFGRSPQKGVSTSGNGKCRRRSRSLAVLLHRGPRGSRHRSWPDSWQVGQDGLGSGRGSCPSWRAAGDDLPHVRDRPGDDRLQPLESAARTRQSRRRDSPLRLISADAWQSEAQLGTGSAVCED